MLIFGKDDNDDNLELDFDGIPKQTPPSPPMSSLPTRPATRSPFGSNSDQVDNLVPETTQGTPERPSSPFGQPAPASRLPQKPAPVLKKPERPALENKETPTRRPQPVAPPVVESNPVPSFPAPPVPDISTYLPPVSQQESGKSVAQADPEVLSESELFVRTMQEHAQKRAESAKAAEEKAKKAAEILAKDASSAPVEATIVPVAEPENSKKKKKQGFFSPPPKKDSKKPNAPREHKYDGDRKKILYIRLVAGTVAAVITVAGMNAIFNPSTGPSKEMVQSAAKEAVNYTGFPTTSGEQFALDFAKAYFNYDSTADYETRQTSLERFASPELIKQIDVQKLSSSDYEAIKKEGTSYSQYNVSQSISYGPYVVASKNVTDKYALFTVKVGLKAGTVLYYDIPVKYSPEKYALTLAGPPSFSKPIDNTDEADKDEWTTNFDGGGDSKLAAEQQKDIEEYFKAWSASNNTLIERYVLLPTDANKSEATDNAKRGLQGKVTFNKIIDLKIQAESEDDPSTVSQRRAEVNVLWEDPLTNLRYPQQYRMLIIKNSENKWVVYDIQNFVILNSPK